MCDAYRKASIVAIDRKWRPVEIRGWTIAEALAEPYTTADFSFDISDILAENVDASEAIPRKARELLERVLLSWGLDQVRLSACHHLRSVIPLVLNHSINPDIGTPRRHFPCLRLWRVDPQRGEFPSVVPVQRHERYLMSPSVTLGTCSRQFER